MLMLTRREGEKIMIGRDIEILIAKIGNGQIKIGIEAPKNVSVHREEIFNKINFDELEEI